MTYIGALLNLLVLLLLLPLIALFFRFGAEFLADASPKHAEWELFTYEFRSYLHGSADVMVINGGKGVRMTDGTGDLSVELYVPVIRKQRSGQGHEIMLTGVKSAQFRLSGNRLTISAEFTGGIRKEETYAIPRDSQ